MFFIQENSKDLLDQEIIELMPMPSISNGNSNVAAILISTESIDDDDDDDDDDDYDDDDDDDDDKEEGYKNDFLDQEKIEVLSMPSTSQGNDKASAILISTENIGDDADEDIGNDFLDQQNMEQLSMPSTSHGNSNAASMLISIENIDDEDDEETDSFTTQMLFSFAWQISKGMVGINMR